MIKVSTKLQKIIVRNVLNFQLFLRNFFHAAKSRRGRVCVDQAARAPGPPPFLIKPLVVIYERLWYTITRTIGKILSSDVINIVSSCGGGVIAGLFLRKNLDIEYLPQLFAYCLLHSKCKLFLDVFRKVFYYFPVSYGH